MIHLKIEEIDGRTAVVLDDAALASLGAAVGDVLTLNEDAVEVHPARSETDVQLDLAREAMVDYRETLDVLAG